MRLKSLHIEILDESAKIVRGHFKGCRPAIGLILGSAWETAVDIFAVKKRLSYALLPALGKTTVAGHAGMLLWAESAGVETLVFQGRRHWYEGAGMDPIAFPIYLLKKLGASAVILTNSAGGIRSDLKRGALMAISDHINLTGLNPLCGKHDYFWGPRFADQTNVYDRKLRLLIKKAARKHKIPLKEGVYLAVSGPTYETPAEILAFRKLGADAVGMSTVPEAMLANAAGLKVAALSLISNAAAGLGGKPLDHGEVCRSGRKTAETIKKILMDFWALMSKKGM